MNSTLTGALPIPIFPFPALATQVAAPRTAVKLSNRCDSLLNLSQLVPDSIIAS